MCFRRNNKLLLLKFVCLKSKVLEKLGAEVCFCLKCLVEFCKKQAFCFKQNNPGVVFGY